MTIPAHTEAARRRFIAGQRNMHQDAPDKLWDRYTLFIDCVWGDDNFSIKTFKQWLCS